MNSRVSHLAGSLLLSLRTEIFLTGLVSITASIWAMIDLESLPAIGIRWLEIALVCWLGFRLALAESGFRTHGGWETRPFRRWEPLAAQFRVLATVFFPLILLRAVCVQAVMTPSPDGWFWILRYQWLPTLGWGVGAFFFVAVIGRRLADGAVGRLPAGIVELLLICGLAMAAVLEFSEGTRMPGWQSPRWGKGREAFLDQKDLGGLLQASLPEGTEVMGSRRIAIPKSNESPLIEEVIRMPLRMDARAVGGMLSCEIQWILSQGGRLEVAFVTDECGESSPGAFGYAVRYADGSYGPIQEHRFLRPMSGISLLPLNRIRQKGSFLSPGKYAGTGMTREDLLQGAELIVYRPTSVVVAFRDPRPARLIEKEIPPYPTNNDPETIRRYVYAVVLFVNQWMVDTSEYELNAREIPALIECHAWSDRVWDSLVKQVFIKHVDELHREKILELLRHDPRMGSVVVAKGWFEEALPTLRQQFLEGLRVPQECLIELAKLRDPALAEPLVRHFLREKGDVAELGPLVRDHPGVDWNHAVSEGWKRRKYRLVRGGSVKNFAGWAAASGEIDALRWLAERAVSGEMDCRFLLVAALGESVPPGVDAVDWLRESLEELRFEGGRFQVFP